MKYSMPLPDDPSRLARQTVITRGKFAGSSGSSPAKPRRPGLQLPDHVVADALARPGRVVGQVERVAVEGGVRGRPAHPGGLGERVGERLAAEQAPAERAGQLGGAEALVPPLVGVQVEERRAGHVPGRPLPVQRERDLLEPGQRPHLLLADVVRPAAAVHALAAAQHGEREERAVDLVGVEPVVGPGAHRDHRPAAGQLGAAGELPRHPRRGRGRHRGDRLLPGRRGRRGRVVVAGRPLPRQPGAGHRVLRQQQVEHGGHQPAAEPDHRHPAADHGAALGLARVEAGQADRDRVLVPAVQRQHRVDPAEVEVPPALARLGVARGQRAVRQHRLTGRRVEQHGLVRGAALLRGRRRPGTGPARSRPRAGATSPGREGRCRSSRSR